MRTLVRFLASSLLVGSTVTALVGCSGNSSGAGADAEDNPFAPPAGCTQTQCDVDRDSCDSDQASQCSQCESLCENPYADPSCFDTCTDICDDPSRDANCADEYASCQQTPENTQCVAGAGSAIDAGRATRDGGSDADARSTTTTTANPGQPRDAGAGSATDAPMYLYCDNPAAGGALPPVRANTAPQAACTDDEIQTIASVVDDESTKLGVIGDTSPSCQACALSQVQDATWGPLIQISGTRVMLNQGTCVANFDPRCGTEVNQLFLCIEEACSTCTDEVSDDDCSSDAQAGVCAEYALDDDCAFEAMSGASSGCFPRGNVSDVDLASYVLTLQCGSM